MKHSRAFQMVLLIGASCHAQVPAVPILKSSDLQADAAILRRAYQELHPGLYRYNTRAEMDTWDKSFRDWGSSAIDLAEPWPTAPTAVPYLRLNRYDDETDDIVKPAGKRFRGKVFVLIDASNSSATFQFALNIQNHHLGILVGQTTGGSQQGINGGAFFFLRLPPSGIEMDLPLIGTFPSLPAPDAGITPNIVVMSKIEDIENRRDAVIGAVLKARRQ